MARAGARAHTLETICIRGKCHYRPRPCHGPHLQGCSLLRQHYPPVCRKLVCQLKWPYVCAHCQSVEQNRYTLPSFVARCCCLRSFFPSFFLSFPFLYLPFHPLGVRWWLTFDFVSDGLVAGAHVFNMHQPADTLCPERHTPHGCSARGEGV